MTLRVVTGACALSLFAGALSAQEPSEKRGSDNLTVVSHLPLGGAEAIVAWTFSTSPIRRTPR